MLCELCNVEADENGKCRHCGRMVGKVIKSPEPVVEKAKILVEDEKEE